MVYGKGEEVKRIEKRCEELIMMGFIQEMMEEMTQRRPTVDVRESFYSFSL